MEVITINTRRIKFTNEEYEILRKAKKILDDFNAECSEGTCADDAASMLDRFLSEDIPGGYYTEVM